jgi:hypothetical protein
MYLSASTPFCPYCHNTRSPDDVVCQGHSTTLVGHQYGKDNNHHTRNFQCRLCDKGFKVENKGAMVWYVEPETNKVLEGIPACFESYVYTCSKCDGDVHRHYYDMDLKDTVKFLSYGSDKNGKSVKKFRTIFSCDDCGNEAETDDNYFSIMSYMPKKRGRVPKPKPINWTITEEVGVVMINDYAASKVTTPKEGE